MNKKFSEDSNKNWDLFFKDKLNFNSKSIFSKNINNTIISDECNDNSKIVSIDSEAYDGKLDYLGDKKNTIFIVNSISKLEHMNDNNISFSSNGSSSIIPATETFHEISKSRRKSISIILNIANYIDIEDLYQLQWKNSHNIKYGNLIDKIMAELYLNPSNKRIEKIKDGVGVALSLSIDNNQTKFINRTCIFEEILEIIDKNYNDNTFSLSTLSEKVGVSTKTIQNILAKYNVKFYTYLQLKRLNYFEYLLKTNKHYNLEYLAIHSGFKNLDAANREFKKKNQTSIRKYLLNDN